VTGVLGRGSIPRHSLVGAVPLLNVKKREVMMKYQIVDWTYRRLWPNKCFEGFLEAWDFVIENYIREDYDDIFIVPMED
tara:strand:+ start:811 stop:1047 length:237 start_codon:yes stop_codon:yes gene_type:complete